MDAFYAAIEHLCARDCADATAIQIMPQRDE
jgi:hypothetical protein